MSSEDVQSIGKEEHKDYLYVFMIVGLVTLFPLILLTAVVTIRAKVPNICRFICLCITMALASGVCAMLLLHFALGPKNLRLTRGDQIIIGGRGESFLLGFNQFHSLACASMSIRSNRLGIVVWAVSLSLNRGAAQNYSLELLNWTLPTHIKLRLDGADILRVRNLTGPIEASVLKGEESWKKWNTADTYQVGYEKCCSWKTIEPRLDGETSITVDEEESYTVILRYINTLDRRMRDNQTSFTGAIDLYRARWAPTPCDPILCDGTTTVCRTNNMPESYIIDYAVQNMTAPPYDEANTQITCNPRHWALAMIFSIVPLLVASLTLFIWRQRIARKKRQWTSNTASNSEVERQVIRKYDRQNPAFEMDMV